MLGCRFATVHRHRLAGLAVTHREVAISTFNLGSRFKPTLSHALS